MKFSRRLPAGVFALIMLIPPMTVVGGERSENEIAPAQGVAAQRDLSDREKSLIDILRLPMVTVNFAWRYRPSDFDAMRWGDREKQLAERKNRLKTMDAGGSPEACADLIYEMACLLTDLGRKIEARPLLERAADLYRKRMEQNGKNAPILYKLGLVLQLGEKKPDARAQFRAALDADAGFCLPYLELLKENRGDKQWLSEAERCFAKRIEGTERTAEDFYHYHLFLYNRAFGDFVENAPNMFREPAGIQVIATRWKAALSDRSVALVKNASDLAPQNIQYRAMLAALQGSLVTVAYLENLATVSDEPSGAGSAHMKAVRRTREQAGALYREAGKNLAFVDARSKNVYPALYTLDGALQIMSGENDKAEQALLKAISLDPSQELNYEMLAYLYVRAVPQGTQPRQEQLEKLAGLLEKKCEISCTSMERRIIARIRFGVGRYPEAESHLRAALARDPLSLPLRAGLAVTLFKMGRFADAEKELIAAKDLYERGEAEDADKAHYCSLVAVFHLLRGDEESAVQWLQRALERNPNDPVARALAR